MYGLAGSRKKSILKIGLDETAGNHVLVPRFQRFQRILNIQLGKLKKVFHYDFEIIGFEREMLRRHWILEILLDFCDMPAHVQNDKLTSAYPFWTNRYARTIYGSSSLHFCNNIGYT